MTTMKRPVFRVDSNYMFAPYGDRHIGATHYVDFPMRVSIPAGQGTFLPEDRLAVREAGELARVAHSSIKPMHLWPDGSVRVWEVWMPVSLKRGQSRDFYFGLAGREPRTKLPNCDLSLLPSRVVVTAVMGDGEVASQAIEFDPTTAGDGLWCREDERPFELSIKGQVAFKGAVIRRRWSWYSAAEFSITATNFMPGEESDVKSLTLEIDLPAKSDKSARYFIRHTTLTAELPRLVESAAPFEVRSDAGGVHVTDIRQLGREQTDYAIYERGPYAEAVDPWIGWNNGESSWVLTVLEARERAPKGWHIRDGHVTLELHPAWAEPLKWRRGMTLFQRAVISQIPRDAPAVEYENESLRWLRSPIVTVASDIYRAAGWRIPFRYEPWRFPRTELAIRETWAFNWTTGTFEWGDQIQGRSARNLEYDFPACAAKEFARTGHPELWLKARASAEHMMYTDFVVVSDDPWKEGGVPAHCPRHTTGSAYPSHMWAEGLVLYYLLSGDRRALAVATRLGDFFLKYIHERFQVVEGTGREMGWALVALAAVYDVTREDRFLSGMRRVADFYLDRGIENFFPTDATFAIGVGLIGLDRARHFHRDNDTRRFILGVLDEMLYSRMDQAGVFDYWFNSERRTFTYVQSHLPEALDIGYRLSGNIKYLKAAWRLFQIHEAGLTLTVQNKYAAPECGYAAGYHITWTMGCLASFAERGWLDKVQFPEPE